MQVRRFSPDLKIKIPGNHKGMYGVPIQFDTTGNGVTAEQREALAQRVNGLPILLNRAMVVSAMYFEPHSHMEEHSADVPILFIVTRGKGFVRIGGTNGETKEVVADDAILWPAELEHTIWTEDESLDAIVIDGPPEREES